jgi:hypothetical protein
MVLEGILRVERGAEEGDGFRAKRENFLSLAHSTHGSLENRTQYWNAWDKQQVHPGHRTMSTNPGLSRAFWDGTLEPIHPHSSIMTL